MPLSSVLGAQSLVRPGVCTSSTRPASPFEGQVIYETDTDKVLVYNGSAWYAPWNTAWGMICRTESQTSSASIGTTETQTLATPSFTAVANRYYKITYYEPILQPSTPTPPGYITVRIRITDVNGTAYQYSDLEPVVSTSSDGQQAVMQIVTTLSAGSTVFVGTLRASSNTVVAYGGSTVKSTRFIMVEDVGPA